LIAAIDDATGEVPWAIFRPEEDSAGYFLLLKHLFQTHGLPLAVYVDRHTIFQSPKKASIAEELAGKPPRSQLGRMLDELEIQLIPAHSPQAKGRIERLFGTFQDRLVKTLRRDGASSLQDANRVLPGFLPGYNARFAIPAAQAPSTFRPWPTGLRSDDVFCFKHERVVAKDNTISFSGHRLPIEPASRRRSYAHRRVEVRQLLNGQLLVCYLAKPLVRFKPLDPRASRRGEVHTRRTPTGPGSARGREAGLAPEATSAAIQAGPESSLATIDHRPGQAQKTQGVTDSLNCSGDIVIELQPADVERLTARKTP
jgi:hypothetical protein